MIDKKTFIIGHIPTLIGISVLALLVVWANPYKVYNAFLESKMEYMVLAIISYLFAIFIRSQKTYEILNIFKSGIGREQCFYYYIISTFLAITTPGRIGEPLIAALIKKIEDIPIKNLMPLLILDRIIDFSIIFVYANFSIYIIAPSFLTKIINYFTDNIINICLLLFLASIVIFGIYKMIKKTNTPLLTEISIGFRELKRKPFILFKIVGFTFAGWLPEIFSIYLIMKSYGIEVDYIQAIAIYTIGILAGVISMIPGGTGASELSMIALTSLLGFPKDLCTSAFLVNKILLVATIIVISTYAKKQVLKK